MPLEKPDVQHLLAAHGYIQLGMFEEANGELEEIGASNYRDGGYPNSYFL